MHYACIRAPHTRPTCRSGQSRIRMLHQARHHASGFGVHGCRVHHASGFRLHHASGFRVHQASGSGYIMHQVSGYTMHQVSGYTMHQVSGYNRPQVSGYTRPQVSGYTMHQVSGGFRVPQASCGFLKSSTDNKNTMIPLGHGLRRLEVSSNHLGHGHALGVHYLDTAAAAAAADNVRHNNNT